MKTLIVLATLCFLVFARPVFADQMSAGSSAGQSADDIRALAPADATFGRARMSVLGIRNAIRDVALRVDGASVDDLASLYHKLTMVDDALIDLRDHYPDDTWLPSLGLNLALAYAKMPTSAAQIRANDSLDWLIADYPSSDQATYAAGLRHARLRPPVSMDVPIEPILPSYAVPY